MNNSKNKKNYDETLRNQNNGTFNAKETRKLEYFKNKSNHTVRATTTKTNSNPKN
jgi:hypothetical protein